MNTGENRSIPQKGSDFYKVRRLRWAWSYNTIDFVGKLFALSVAAAAIRHADLGSQSLFEAAGIVFTTSAMIVARPTLHASAKRSSLSCARIKANWRS
jgi:hypothetical protein